MKHLLFIIMLLPLAVFAQSKYMVCEVHGSVTVKHSEHSTWQILKTYTSLDSLDTIKLENNSQVRICCKRTNRVYFCNEIGSITVEELVGRDESNRNRSFAALNKHVFKQNRSNDATVKISASAVRNVQAIRDTSSSNTNPYQALYEYLQYCSNHTEPLVSDSVFVERIDLGHGTFGIKVTNKSSNTLYCNMVNITDGRMQLCYFFDEDINLLPLDPGTTADITPYPLFADSKYLFFATKKDMDISDIDILFEKTSKTPAADHSNMGIIVVKP